MPYVNGRIGPHGATVDVVFGVPQIRLKRLRSVQLPVPRAVHAVALIDTGASLSAVSPRILRALELQPIGQISVITPSTPAHAPDTFDRYNVALSMVAGGGLCPLPETLVMSVDCWTEGEGFDALIGRDILDRCHFMYYGPEGNFTLAPS
jgi:hypothetical protein